MDTSAQIAQDSGVLTLVYKDLAQPGVRQVGKALETTLQLGSSLLLPVRLLNEKVKQFEERKFREIAARFNKIPDEEIVDVSPEIGVPILEALSITADSSLRTMFIELLAKSATMSELQVAHPVFVKFISSLSPDEAKILMEIKGAVPFIDLVYKSKNEQNIHLIRELSRLKFEDFSEISYPNNIDIYMENLFGLGLIYIERIEFIAEEGIYESIFDKLKPSVKYDHTFEDEGLTWNLDYRKGLIYMTSLGETFARAVSQH